MEKRQCEVCGNIIDSRWNVRFERDTIHCKDCYRTDEAEKIILAKKSPADTVVNQLSVCPEEAFSTRDLIEKTSLPDVVTYLGWIVFTFCLISAVTIYTQTSIFFLAFPWLTAALIGLILLLAIARALTLLEVIAINTKG